MQRHVILLIDQSGSMAESIVYAGVFGAVWPWGRAVTTSLVVVDTEVVDLTDEIDDPVDVLFGIQLGGGTDINRPRLRSGPGAAVAGHRGRADQLRRSAEVVGSGATRVALLALSDSGAPSVDATHAAALAGRGVPAFACTPDLVPDLIAAAIERRDLGQWASAHDIVTTHAD